jgi:tRNA A58 N-methylase Trm61
LPEGFRPAPRETEADQSGKTDTLDRKLKDAVYLLVDNKLPTTTLDNPDSETLLDAAKRAISENGGSQLEFYCPSNAPVAVHMTKAEEGSSFFGTKTFFLRLQYDDGTIQAKDLKKKQTAWLDRSEIIDLFEGLSDGTDAKFYRYLL